MWKLRCVPVHWDVGTQYLEACTLTQVSSKMTNIVFSISSYCCMV